MLPLSWIDRVKRLASRLAGRREPIREAVRVAGLGPRRLEPRRVLSATIQSLIVPAVATEGDTVAVSAPIEGGSGAYEFDWTVTHDSQVVEQSDLPTFSFSPPDDGQYSIDLRVTDLECESTDTGAALLMVQNAPPVIENLAATPIFENGLTTLSGRIVDPGLLDTFTLNIKWGDPLSPGNIQTVDLASPETGVMYDAETGEFSLTHRYLDDNPTGTPSDTYSILVTATDDDGGQGEASTTVAVSNLNPTVSGLSATPISENQSTTLTGRIADPGTRDTFTLTINWGDPLSPGNVQTVDLTSPGPGTTFVPATGEFAIAHQYLDDNPTNTSGDDYKITVVAKDDDGGQATATATARVANVEPRLAGVAAVDIDENGETTLSGRIIDPGTRDTFTLTVNWGDGQVEDFTLPAGATEFQFRHRYLDDQPGALPDLYRIRLTLVDDDLDVAVDAVDVGVRNVPPVIKNLAATNVLENQSTTLTGTIVDPGSLDTFRLTINWGDPQSPGNVQTVDLTSPGPGVTFVPATGEFSITHQYLDDKPTATQSDPYKIRVTARDDDGGASTSETVVVVTNVTPRIENLSATDVDENGVSLLTGTIVDPGTLDTFDLVINWGDGSPNSLLNTTTLAPGFIYNAATGVFTVTHQYLDDNPTGTPADSYRILVAVIDDDRDISQAETYVEVRNVAPVVADVDDVEINEGERVVLGIPISLNGAPTQSSGITMPPTGATVAAAFTDVGTLDTHTATIDWGDGTEVQSLGVVDLVTQMVVTGEHTYADNGLYTVTISVIDDDIGVGQTMFQVRVSNTDPVLTGTDGLRVDEGSPVTLAGLGVGISDPGFDNPLNVGMPGNGGEVAETFVGVSIDWGDGSLAAPIDAITNRTSGGPGVATTAGLGHAAHHYADNGTYTVTVRLGDDDGGVVARSFTIVVDNVNPTLTLTDEAFVIEEGDVLTLTALGSFTDPGFDNALNPKGPSQETFDYLIDWGDGTADELRLPVSTVSGGPGVATSGALTSLLEPISHHYADNDADNLYTISVTLRDDDGGYDHQSFDIFVFNVNPTLEPISATDLASDAVTTLELEFADPGADSFRVMVDWGDRLFLPEDQRYVEEVAFAGPTPQSFTIQHAYTGPPDPANPAAGIVISVMVLDDDFGSAALSIAAGPVDGPGQVPGTGVVTGMSNARFTVITNPGLEGAQTAIDLSADVESITFPEAPALVSAPQPQNGAGASQQSQDAPNPGGDLSATADRYFELRVLKADGTLAAAIRLPADAMDDLPKLFARLPDYHYQIWLIRVENNSERLVIDFYLRGGKVIDPADDTEGARDRPPTDESGAGQQQTTEPATDAQSQFEPQPTTGDLALASATGLTLAVAATRRRSRKTPAAWGDELEAALDAATETDWRRLRWRRLPR